MHGWCIALIAHFFIIKLKVNSGANKLAKIKTGD